MFDCRAVAGRTRPLIFGSNPPWLVAPYSASLCPFTNRIYIYKAKRIEEDNRTGRFCNKYSDTLPHAELLYVSFQICRDPPSCIFIAVPLSKRRLPGMPRRESNSGLTYSKRTHYQLSNAAPCISVHYPPPSPPNIWLPSAVTHYLLKLRPSSNDRHSHVLYLTFF